MTEYERSLALDRIRLFNARINGERNIYYYNKHKFIESLNLTHSDWRKIRSKEYWRNMPKIDIDKAAYTLTKIRAYKFKNNIKRIRI